MQLAKRKNGDLALVRRVLPLPGFEASSGRKIQTRQYRASVSVEPFGGVASRAGAMRAIAPSMPKNVCPRQGRRKPTSRLCAAGAGVLTTVETCVSPAAKLRPTTRALRR